ncbi:MAG: hypothetical protein P8079_07625, partial [Gammaproteobacteria bacterium]
MLVVAAAIILALLALPRKESPPRDIAGKQPVNTIASTAQTTAAPQSPAPGADRLAGVTVVLLNNGKQFPL